MLTSFIQQGNQLLDKYGIAPKKSVYRIYSNDKWNNFCSSRNSDLNSEGMYLPRTLSAHLKQETPFLQLNLFHEYFGHGSFCEHSEIGKRIVQYEQELAGIEKQILGVEELPQNEHFVVDKSNPCFSDYTKLREEFDKYFRRCHNNYEGFAVWLEFYFALRLDLQELSEEKRKRIKHHDLTLLLAFEDFVSRNNENALLEKLEFQH